MTATHVAARRGCLVLLHALLDAGGPQVAVAEDGLRRQGHALLLADSWPSQLAECYAEAASLAVCVCPCCTCGSCLTGLCAHRTPIHAAEKNGQWEAAKLLLGCVSRQAGLVQC